MRRVCEGCPWPGRHRYDCLVLSRFSFYDELLAPRLELRLKKHSEPTPVPWNVFLFLRFQKFRFFVLARGETNTTTLDRREPSGPCPSLSIYCTWNAGRESSSIISEGIAFVSPVVFFPKRRKVTEEPVAKVELFKLCSHQQLAALPLAGRLEGKERKKNFSKEEGGEEKGDCSSSCISGIPSLVGRVPTVSFPSVPFSF